MVPLRAASGTSRSSSRSSSSSTGHSSMLLLMVHSRSPTTTLPLQIDRADGSAGDLATQMASGLNLGGGGGGAADPRAPVRA